MAQYLILLQPCTNNVVHPPLYDRLKTLLVNTSSGIQIADARDGNDLQTSVRVGGGRGRGDLHPTQWEQSRTYDNYWIRVGLSGRRCRYLVPYELLLVECDAEVAVKSERNPAGVFLRLLTPGATSFAAPFLQHEYTMIKPGRSLTRMSLTTAPGCPPLWTALVLGRSEFDYQVFTMIKHNAEKENTFAWSLDIIRAAIITVITERPRSYLLR
ncbi:hypothetical protein J6590_106615 [Homalodisca vitripennis]|nr:hypothetical protein J6590_106615 [Homalodisca vitripennis]